METHTKKKGHKLLKNLLGVFLQFLRVYYNLLGGLCSTKQAVSQQVSKLKLEDHSIVLPNFFTRLLFGDAPLGFY